MIGLDDIIACQGGGNHTIEGCPRHETLTALSLSSSLLLKLSNLFDLRDFILLFFLFPILVLVQILITFVRIFRITRRGLTYTVRKGMISLNSRLSRGADKMGVGDQMDRKGQTFKISPPTPVFFPTVWVASLAFLIASSSACFCWRNVHLLSCMIVHPFHVSPRVSN